jgi:hypothetical protein
MRLTSLPLKWMLPWVGKELRPTDAAQQCGLAHAVVAQDTNRFALCDVQVNTMQYWDTAIACVELLNVEHAGSFC